MRRVVVLTTVVWNLVAGCSPTSPGPGAEEAAVEACAAVATLYPRERLGGDEIRNAVVGKHWARRDGGRGSMHGPPMLWRRSNDLQLEARDGKVALTYDVLEEATGKEAAPKKIEKDCQICGEVLVCDQAVWVLSTQINDAPGGTPLDQLSLDAVAEMDHHDLYLVRHGHEILLDFGVDPREATSGSLEIRTRKLEKGAVVTKSATTFTSEPMAPGYGGRSVRIDLPGSDGIRLDFRPDRRPEGGYGTDTTIEPTLHEMTGLKKNPQLMKQPESLDLPADAPGFYLPQ